MRHDNAYFLKESYLYSGDFIIDFIVRNVWNFTPQFREIFLWRETVPRELNFIKSRFSVTIMQYFEKKW